MKLFRSFIGCLCCCLFFLNAKADTFYVSTQQEFSDAHNEASVNDTIIWKEGIYSNIFMSIKKDHLYIKAETLGETIFQGTSRVEIEADYITFEGFQFLNGNLGPQDIISTKGSYNVFTQLNIRGYRSHKYLIVRAESQYCEITYCNFENRVNLDDQNILSILVDETNPGYHKIQHCSFKNFDGTGNDLGIEPIRIGVSSQAEYISRCLVEYCYFTQCNGDGEIISSKATQNVYRFNTFEDNPLAELVLRHGSEAIVYGNFFLNGKGGVRVREGQDHYIYNNYFHELNDRAIYLQNDDSDPLDNINIAFNTISDCSELRLGGLGDDKPTNVTLANNIFTDPDNNLFKEPTGTETWINNISFGPLGLTMPASGITNIDPQLEQNTEGYFGLSASSPAIDAAQTGFALLPQFEGMEGIDGDIIYDIMGQSRPSSAEERDLGCSEYPHDILIQPIATEENTGPSYETSTSTHVQDALTPNDYFVEINPNPVSDQLNIKLSNQIKGKVLMEIYDLEGRMIKTIIEKAFTQDELRISHDIADLPIGLYHLRVVIHDSNKGKEAVQVTNFIKPQ